MGHPLVATPQREDQRKPKCDELRKLSNIAALTCVSTLLAPLGVAPHWGARSRKVPETTPVRGRVDLTPLSPRTFCQRVFLWC